MGRAGSPTSGRRPRRGAGAALPGVTDIARAARDASAGSRGPLRAAARGFTVTVVPFDAYLDERGRLRKLRQRFTFTNGAEVVSTTRFSAFGSPVRVVLPDRGAIYRGKIVSAAGTAAVTGAAASTAATK